MTWQSINDDTYIDETLVTCAEYQLFIDEMREQGKYYQPDHWTSYQFPQGQARAPILGVRRLDAIAFCVWLSQRDELGWEYRLPSKVEAMDFIKIQNVDSPMGIWIIDSPNSPFVMIGLSSVDARCLLEDRIIETGLKITNGNALSFIEDIEYAKKIKRRLHGKLVDEATLIIDILSEQRNLPLDLGVGQIINLDFFPKYLERMDLDKSSLKNSNEIINTLVNKSFHPPIDLEFTLNFLSTIILGFGKLPSYYYDSKEINRITSLFIDIFTLQERIAGRSPAFEGIRLVKERIR